MIPQDLDVLHRSLFALAAFVTLGASGLAQSPARDSRYPAHWWTAVSMDGAPSWEILPQEAGPREVILSKRHELGLLSNFAPTPFTFRGKRYASLEGFWQTMLYPEGSDDPRVKFPGLVWKHTREEVAQMTAFVAKDAGTLAEASMAKMGIDWVTFEGRRIEYRPAKPGAHYDLIFAATEQKVLQNPEVRRALLSTGDLILKPDHHQEPNAPAAWRYFEILTKIRAAYLADQQLAASRLDALLGDLHRRGLFDGAVVVGEAGRVVFEKGYGLANVERRVAFTPDTASDGASLAKTFTAALVLQLRSEKRLDIDAPAQRYVREMPYAEVTLRHLLSHTSGIPVDDYDYFDKFLPRDAIRTTDVLLGVLAAQKPTLASKPGTTFSYSSFGFDLAALAASRVAGATYEQLLRDRFFRPLDISSAFVRPGRLSDFPGVRTIGYRRVKRSLEPNEVFDREAFHGGSNVYISARDLHRWNLSFLVRPLLSAPALSESLAQAKIGADLSGLTLGSWYRTDDGDAFWYSGHLQGFHNEVFRRVSAERSIVYVSNNTIDPWLQKALVRAIESVLSGHEPATIDPPVFEAVPVAARESLAGKWRMTDGTTWTIERSPRLAVSNGTARYPIFPVGQAFYVPGLDLIIGFKKDAAGLLTRIQVSSNIEDISGTRER